MNKIFLIVLFLPLFLFSKDWSTFYPDSEINYVANGSSGTAVLPLHQDEVQQILYTCRFKFSTKQANEDSIFVPFSTNSSWPPVDYFTSFEKHHNGIEVVGTWSGNYLFPASFSVGQSWKCFVPNFSSDSIVAVCNTKTWESFLGVTDSVYTIELTSGIIIKLSKKFGIIQWQESSATMTIFMSDKINPKHRLTDCRNSFKLKKGYVYAGSKGVYNNMGTSYGGSSRMEVLDKVEYANYISYSLGIWTDRSYYNCGPSPCPSKYYYRDTIEVKVYADSIKNWGDFFPPAGQSLVSIYQNDTIFYFGGIVKPDLPCPNYVYTTKEDFKQYEEYGLFYQLYTNLVTCYYPSSTPLTCSSSYDLMTAIETATAQSDFFVTYQRSILEIVVSDQSEHHYQILDVTGRVLYSGAFYGKANISIPVKSGIYKVRLDDNHTKNFVVIE